MRSCDFVHKLGRLERCETMAESKESEQQRTGVLNGKASEREKTSPNANITFFPCQICEVVHVALVFHSMIHYLQYSS